MLSKKIVEIKLSAWPIPRFIFFLVLGTTMISALTQTVRYAGGHGRLFGLTDLFDMDSEQSFPTWLNLSILFACSVLVWIIAARQGQEKKKFTGSWRLLAWIFLIMSVDEIAGWHEHIGYMMKIGFRTSGIFTYAFVIPGFVIALAVFTVSFRLLCHLPRKIAGGMILSGALYLFGVIVMESLGGLCASLHTRQYGPYAAMAIIEEFSEMTALVLMMRTLLAYLASLCPDKILTLELKLGR